MDQLLSTSEYAAKRQVKTVAVTRAMKKGKKLVGVKSYRKIGRDWFLTVCNPVSKKDLGKCVVIQK